MHLRHACSIPEVRCANDGQGCEWFGRCGERAAHETLSFQLSATSIDSLDLGPSTLDLGPFTRVFGSGTWDTPGTWAL